MSAVSMALAVLCAGAMPAFLDGHVPAGSSISAPDTDAGAVGHNHAFCALVGASPGLSVPPPEQTLDAAPLGHAPPPDVVVFTDSPSPTRRWHSRAPPVV